MKGFRSSGILLHITSLPGDFGIGDLGPGAEAFADFLAVGRQRLWQVLPLNPTDSYTGNSPYSSLSAFAADPLLLSPERLVEDGLLTADEVGAPPAPDPGRVDFTAVRSHKADLLDRVFRRYREVGPPAPDDWARFRDENHDWTEDFALFSALRRRYPDGSWLEWPAEVRDREPGALRAARQELQVDFDRALLMQYLFDRQWRRLHATCRDRGIQILGDVPFYVSLDSADVWSHREIFLLRDDGRPTHVSGVPPDYFSPTGQRWGNPLYDWDRLASSGYSWWLRRLERNLGWFDLVRIDHFRGFSSFWKIPADDPDATGGEWHDGPGMDFFDSVSRRFPRPALVAEDLGIITAEVRELVERTDLPGMRVLQFAFGEDFPRGIHLPHDYPRHSLAYTGTHDNNTTRGWLEEEAGPSEKHNLYRYLGRPLDDVETVKEMIRRVLASPADTAILPLQDLLCLGSEARMNRPSLGADNWRWRARSEELTRSLAEELAELTDTYGRA